MKKFLKNKLINIINVDDKYGVPNQRNQDMIRESFFLQEIVQLMDHIWPDEHYLRNEF